MRKITKSVAIVMCLISFALMAMGSGSSGSGETKDVVDSKDEGLGEVTTDVSIENQELINQGDIVVTATEYVTDSIFGDGIKILIENNSQKDVSIGCNALIVNNYMITNLFSADIAAGKKSNEVMYLASSELKAAGIDTVGQIEAYFKVYDSSSYEDIFIPEVVTIQTSEYANMDVISDDNGKELYNKDGIRIVGKTVDENSFWGTAILLYIENTSSTNVGIQCDNMSINGFMTTPFFSCEVYGGKKAIDDIVVLSSDLEDNNIESIEEVELKFHIFNADTYDTIADSDAITFSAE